MKLPPRVHCRNELYQLALIGMDSTELDWFGTHLVHRTDQKVESVWWRPTQSTRLSLSLSWPSLKALLSAVRTAFKIESFTAHPKGSSPSKKCKVKIVFKKNLKFEFYPSNKEGYNLYQHFERKANLKLPIHINISICWYSYAIKFNSSFKIL